MDGDVLKEIKARRNALGIKQNDFAEMAGIPDRTYSDYERGVTPIPSDRLPGIAKALKCSIADLYTKSAIEKPPRDPDHVSLGDLARGDARIIEILEKRLPQEGGDFQKLKEENMKLQAENRELIKSNQFLQDLAALVPKLEEQVKILTTIINDEQKNKKRLYRTAKTDQDLKEDAKRPHSRKAK